MAAILKKAAKYKNIPASVVTGEHHLRDPFTPAPEILKPSPQKKERKPDDITDFPIQKMIPVPESIPYPEGKYKPPSVPVVAGLMPHNTYLQKGKVYSWCACGLATTNPFCDTSCNRAVTRNRPIAFNVSESGYYKICSCKFSANAPFCNGTHKSIMRYHHKTHRGFVEIWGFVAFFGWFGYFYWNFYT